LSSLKIAIMAKQERKTTDKHNEDLELDHMRHSCAHMLAQAVLEMFPDAKLGIGPTIENGFYYDFELPRTLIPEDLDILMEKMRKIANQKQTFVRREEKIDKVIEFYKKANQPYKVEIVEDLAKKGEKIVTFYENFDPKSGKLKFSDLCRGGHSENTGKTGVFKLTKIAGAYWRGDEKRPMLQRIYGVCFKTKQDLNAYLQKLEEAKKRDHRKLGKELKIFTFVEEIGPGLAVWLPNGTIIRDELEKLAREEERRDGYLRVVTPHITKGVLYHRSGHLPYYKDTMYSPMIIDEEEYYLKPMNCPMHHMIYLSEARSYRDLPLRLAEYGQCYRYEKSGELNGLMRVRGMAMNDAHIYCRKDQIKEEFIKVMRMHERHYKRLGVNEYYMRFSRWDPNRKEKYIDQPENWEFCEKMMKEAMDESGIPYTEAVDEAAFYGPKIDFQIKSAIGTEYTISTNQLDFAAGDRFGLKYATPDGKEEKVFVIHRAPLGTHERFIAFLLEHFAGNFPTWLAPVQVAVLPVSDKFLDYAREVREQLFEKGVRVEVDDKNESLGKKIRSAEMNKIPHILVVGEKEVADGTVTARSRKTKEQTTMALDDFALKIFKEIQERSL
jgi:threonyl-tRNA synthetase